MADSQKMTTLEQKLDNLEQITKKLEEGNLSIDESIALYSQGMELAVSCKKSLDEMSLKVSLAKDNASEALKDE